MTCKGTKKNGYTQIVGVFFENYNFLVHFVLHICYYFCTFVVQLLVNLVLRGCVETNYSIFGCDNRYADLGRSWNCS